MMKRIHINNEFTQWAEYLARYFGHDIFIFNSKGEVMWGLPHISRRTVAQLTRNPWVKTVYRDIGQPIAYIDTTCLTMNEYNILCTIIPFIESQLEDEGA